MRPGWSRKLKRSTASTTPMAMPATNARGNDTMPRDHRGGQRPHERARAEGGEVLRPSPSGPPMQRRSTAWPATPATAHTNVDTSFGLMPARRARSGFSADALTRLADHRAVEEPAERERDERHDDEDRELRAGDPDAADLARRHRSASGNAGAGRVDLRVRGEDRQRELGDADGRDEHDDARRVEQPADDDQLDDRAVQRADDERDDQRRARTGTPYCDDEQREQAGADEAHVADREVDDPGRPVDEHDAHREQAEDQAGDDAVEDELAGDQRGEHASAALACRGTRPGRGRRARRARAAGPRSAPGPSRGTRRGRRSPARRSATARR